MSDDEKTKIIAPPDPVAVGTQLSGTYELDQRLASGGMGEVYRGHNIQTGDPVAIKIVLPEFARDATILSLFRKEASVLNHLFHEAIVRYHVFAIDQKIGRPYLAMEFVDGVSLADLFASGPMDPEDARKLLVRLASGLAVAHGAGVIHRDLSPDNIVLPGGKVERAKIIDFGIARSANVGGETLLGGSFAGKYNFVSPEQLGMAGGEVTERSDIYSLGLVIAAALRGKTINMTGSQVDIIEKRRVVPDLTGIDPRMRPVLEAMLQPDPRSRPASMADIAEGLQVAVPQPRNVWDADTPSAPGSATQFPPGESPTNITGIGEAGVPMMTSRTPMPWRVDGEAAGEATGIINGGHGAARPQGEASPVDPVARKRSFGGAGIALSLLAVLALAGGGGAYLGGYFDEAPPPVTGDASPVETAEEPAPPADAQEQAPAEPEQAPAEPAPADVEPVSPQPPPIAGPEASPPETGGEPAGPETGAEPAGPETGGEPAPIPAEPSEPAQPTPPVEAPQTEGSPPDATPDNATVRRDWLNAYSGGDCFYASSLPGSGDKLQIEGFGETVAPFEAMLQAYKAAFSADPEPDIGVRLIAPKQCPTTVFLHSFDRSPEPPPQLSVTRDVLFDGDPLEGSVQLQPGRRTYLLLIDHDGIAHNLGRLLQPSGDRAGFKVQLGLGAGDVVGKQPLPQVLLAFSTSAPVEALEAGKAMPSFQLLPSIVDELRTKRIEGAASARYFRIRG